MKDKKTIIKIVAFVAIVIAIIIADQYFGWSKWLSNKDNLLFLQQIVNDNMIFALVIYCAVTIAGCVFLALPGFIFAILSGLVFGPILGIVACDIACTIGAIGAFVAGRYFLKDAIKPMLVKNKTLEKWLFSGKKNQDIVVLMVTRLVPVFPYNLQNFAYGITDIDILTYSIGTFVFMVPGTAMFVVGASGLTATENSWIYYMVAALICILVVLLGIVLKKRFLRDDD